MHKYVFDAEIVCPWVCEKAGGEWHHGDQGVGLEYDGKLIAGIRYDGYTGSSIAMHSRCDDPKHVTRTFYWLIFDYVFNQLKVKRATGIVSSGNLVAQRINEKLGWKREATLSDYFPDGDAIIYKMTSDSCRWLRVKHDLKIAT